MTNSKGIDWVRVVVWTGIGYVAIALFSSLVEQYRFENDECYRTKVIYENDIQAQHFFLKREHCGDQYFR
jgi:hypothetical protein